MALWRDREKREDLWCPHVSGASLSRDHWDVWLMIMAGDCSQWSKPTAVGSRESSVFLDNFCCAASALHQRCNVFSSKQHIAGVPLEVFVVTYHLFLSGSAPRWYCFSLLNPWIIQFCCLRRRLAGKGWKSYWCSGCWAELLLLVVAVVGGARGLRVGGRLVACSLVELLTTTGK